VSIAILDVDGTLVDTNYQHALAWYRAFRAQQIVLPIWRLHRHIGMGGDKLVAAVTDEDTERQLGDRLRESEHDFYAQMIGEVQAFEGARELVEDLHARGDRVALASSAKPEELEHYIELLGVRELTDACTSAADVEATKPDPQLVEAALAKLGARADDAVMIGDSCWDVAAARRAGMPTLAVMTGGFSAAELTDSGAERVFESIAELRAALEERPQADLQAVGSQRS
jgi:HAD superfamily hydrolase (TIGR01509 family)